jgi:hypothetical protein
MMRHLFRNWKATVSFFCLLLTTVTSIPWQQANAHFPFRHWHGVYRPHFAYRHHYSSGFGGYGFGYRHFPSTYLYIDSYAGTYPFGFCPPAFCSVSRVRTFSAGYFPTVTYPIYSAPVYYAPVYQDPCFTSLGTGYSPYSSFGANSGYSSVRGPRDFFANEPLASARSSSNAFTTSPLASIDLKEKLEQPLMQRSLREVPADRSEAVKLVSHRTEQRRTVSKPRALEPYSPIWTKAAAGLVDEMVKAGHLSDAIDSCKSMEKIEQPKGAGVYLRQGLMRFFAEKKPTSASMSQALDLLNDACQAGSELSATELQNQSLSQYFAACLIDVPNSLEALSKTVLSSPEHSKRELLLLSVLLKLDGQYEKANLFAKEASEQANLDKDFRWDSILSACLK